MLLFLQRVLDRAQHLPVSFFSPFFCLRLKFTSPCSLCFLPSHTLVEVVGASLFLVQPLCRGVLCFCDNPLVYTANLYTHPPTHAVTPKLVSTLLFLLIYFFQRPYALVVPLNNIDCSVNYSNVSPNPDVLPKPASQSKSWHCVRSTSALWENIFEI